MTENVNMNMNMTARDESYGEVRRGTRPAALGVQL